MYKCSIFLHFVIFYSVLLYQKEDHPKTVAPSCELFVGIVSARNNFEQRNSIRNTWFNLLDGKTVAKFILGELVYHSYMQKLLA